MLDPNARSLLTDALTPPPGMKFDAGLATTYSLDPTALLTVPIHLAWLAAGHDKELLADPIRMLEALRRVASRLTVFCQRGQMQAPTKPHVLYGLLEQMLHESVAPLGGSFHAKLWLLRYVHDSADENPLLRLIVQSRNLTFDRSWDISLKLEGMPSGTNRRRNIPLGKLLDVLQTTAVCAKPMSLQRKNLVNSLVSDARQVDWELPGGFSELRFHVLGLDSKPWLPEPSSELAVISPFVRPEALRRLAQTSDRPRLLLARSEELDGIPPDVLNLFESTKVLTEQAASGDGEDDGGGTELGLHAKVYIQQRGWGGTETHLIMGSANATDRVVTPGKHSRSLEFLVELIGKRKAVGSIDNLFATDGMGELLADYSAPPVSTMDAARLASERMLEHVRGQLAGADWLIRCTAYEGDWILSLTVDRNLDTEEVGIRLWPLSVNRDRAVAWAFPGPSDETVMGVFAAQEVTTLLGFELVTGVHELRFALEARIEGMPIERDNAIDRMIICNRDGFIRYLLLLLGSLAGEHEAGGQGARLWNVAALGADHVPPLFDMLASAYAQDPARVAPIARLIRRLSNGSEESVVPEDFLRVWNVFELALIKDGIHVDAP